MTYNAIKDFENYIKSDPNFDGPGMTPGHHITAETLEHVKKDWKLPNATVGDWLIMLKNGKGRIIAGPVFNKTYVKAHTTT